METQFFDYHGTKIAFKQRSGEYPLLLVHGFTASSEIWDPLIAELDHIYELIIVDLFGHGKSGVPDAYLTGMEIGGIISYQAAALAELIKNLGYTEYGLIGSSLGGWVSMELAANYLKPSKLVLIDTAGVVPLSDPDFNLGLSMLVQLYNSQENALSPILNRILASGDDSSTLMNSELIDGADFNIIVIWGTEDPVLKIDYGRKFTSELKDASFIAIEEGGHTPFTTNPEEVAEIINSFFKI